MYACTHYENLNFTIFTGYWHSKGLWLDAVPCASEKTLVLLVYNTTPIDGYNTVFLVYHMYYTYEINFTLTETQFVFTMWYTFIIEFRWWSWYLLHIQSKLQSRLHVSINLSQSCSIMCINHKQIFVKPNLFPAKN